MGPGGLEAWEDTLDLQDAQDDLWGFTPAVAGAHLPIDAGLAGQVDCYAQTGKFVASYSDLGFCCSYGTCMPCNREGSATISVLRDCTGRCTRP